MGFELRAPKCLARCSTNWAIWHVRSKLLAVLNYLKSPSIRDQHVRFFPLERVNLSIPGVGHSTKFNGMGDITNRMGDIMTDQTYRVCKPRLPNLYSHAGALPTELFGCVTNDWPDLAVTMYYKAHFKYKSHDTTYHLRWNCIFNKQLSLKKWSA